MNANGYQIPGIEIRLENVGTTVLPHLYAITSGQRNDGGPKNRSTIFHIKIEDKQHECKLRYVGGKYCLFDCREPTCVARHKFMPKPELIQEFPGFYKKKNGKTRTKYAIDMEQPLARELSSWTVIAHDTRPHGFQKPNCPPPKPCATDFFRPVQRDLREMHRQKSRETNQLEIDQTLENMKLLRRYGPELVGRVCNRNREAQSAYYKMRQEFPFTDPDDVPEHLQVIHVTDFQDALLGKKPEKFFQYKDQDQIIF